MEDAIGSLFTVRTVFSLLPPEFIRVALPTKIRTIAPLCFAAIDAVSGQHE